MLLEQKVAVVYGAGGAIGGAAARAFAREGARVYLAGRTAETLEAAAASIRAAGGAAETAVFDALDEAAVDSFVDGVAARTGGVDISFNVIGFGDVQEPLMELSVDDFTRPVATALRSQFLTTRAAARHMIPRRSGVFLLFGGSSPRTMPGLGALKVTFDAMEGLRRQWALELGPHNIRFVTLQTGGVPESIPDDVAGKAEIAAAIREDSMLGREATLEDVGNVAAFVASDWARSLTSTEVNISCGAIPD
jgi:NAD(P)-dependent dehydrogenase (short-subunit alcohol dehydrogenase family)